MTRVRASGSAPMPMEALIRLRPRDIWRFLKQEPASFWLVCAYLFFEYVRPQAIYTTLAVLPWSQVIMVLGVGAVLLEPRRARRWGVADLALSVFSLTVVISGFTAFRPSVSLKAADLYLGWVVAYALIVSTVTSPQRFLVFFLSFLLYHLKMSQHAVKSWVAFGFAFSSNIVGGPGWFHNSGEMGIAMVMFLSLSGTFYVALRRDWNKLARAFFLALPVSALAAIGASSSRGAQLGAAAVGLWFILKSKKARVRGTIMIVALGAVLYAILPAEERRRFSEMGDDVTSQNRLTMWKDGLKIMREFPVFGIGFENWTPYYRTYYNPGGLVCHNIFIQAGAELGYVGLSAFVLLIGATLVVNARTRRLARGGDPVARFGFWVAHGLDGALVGYLVAGFFVTVLYYPFFWINLAMSVALHETIRRTAVAASAAQAPQPPFVRPATQASPDSR